MGFRHYNNIQFDIKSVQQYTSLAIRFPLAKTIEYQLPSGIQKKAVKIKMLNLYGELRSAVMPTP